MLRYWPWYLSGAVFLVLTNWLAVAIPLEMARGVDAMREGAARAEVLDAALTVAWMGLAVIGVRTLSRVLFFTPGRLCEFEVRNDVFARLLLLQPSFYATRQTGDIISRASNDISFLRVMTGFGTLSIVNVSTALVLTGLRMVELSPSLTLWCAAPVALGWGAVQLAIRRFQALMMKNQQHLGAISDHVLASVQGIRTVQGFNAREAFLERLHARNQDYLATNIELSWLRGGVMPLLAFAGSASIYVLIALGGPMAARGEISVGELVAFVAFVAYLVFPLRSLGWMVSVFQHGVISMERIDELLYAEPERPEGSSPAPQRAGPPRIELRGLSFAYPDETEGRRALVDVSVALPAGAVIGVYGRTGSGKTTLLRALTRLYNPPPGTVFIDGQDVRGLDLDAWRRRMAVVPQVPFLFSDSVAENVALGERDEARLRKAIDDAALTPDLSALPHGLDTIVGERGIMLSGGQRQRTALARGLYRAFDLLILDDTLSAVDQKTEQALIDSLTRVAGGEGGAAPTTIIVSHRLSVMARTDLVLVMDEGRLVDHGPHAELLSRPGLYREAWELQQREEPV
ncbi:MAG: ABC transporter ATP-binding protein [Alphaproteobacteria bacterium]|nr:ABC transporter ATP-binding protein [Alphaproteobacteria bacterium]